MKRIAFLIVSLMLGGVGTAAADGSWGPTGKVCGGDNFWTCMSVSVSWTGNVVTVTVKNEGESGEAFKTVALAGMPAGFAITSMSNLGSGLYGIGLNDGTAGPGPNRKYGAEANAPPTTNAIRPGQTGSWAFTFGGGVFSDAQLNAAYVVVHAIDGDRPNDQNCSTWFWANANGAASVPQGDKWELCNQTVIPEPGSMVLLATGLIGLVGAGVVRQRKRV